MTSNGTKYDEDKPRTDLIPAGALMEIGRVFGFGAKKYGDHNWRLGIAHSRLIAAALRHIMYYQQGQTFDEESGIHHIAHAAVNLLMLMESPSYDDRYQKEYVDNRKNWEKTVGVKRASEMDYYE